VKYSHPRHHKCVEEFTIVVMPLLVPAVTTGRHDVCEHPPVSGLSSNNYRRRNSFPTVALIWDSSEGRSRGVPSEGRLGEGYIPIWHKLLHNSGTVTRSQPDVAHMRTYLAPLGFDSRRVVRPVLSEGLDESDRVVLLQPTNNSDQGQDAFEEVKDVLTQVVPDLELESEYLPYTDFVETTLLCADLMQAAEGETIVVLGGGAREILLPLTVATFSNEKYIDTVLQVGDIDSSVRRIPRLNLRGNISNAEAALLADLSDLDTPLSISDIATKLEKSKSTIARHVDSLESEGFVKTAKQGRTKTVEPTDSGRIFLSSRESDHQLDQG